MIDFDIVVAHDHSKGIGKNNQLIWSIPEDMAFFKQLTTSSNKTMHTVIMGRATYDSLPQRFKPLPGRHNVVLTRSKRQNEPNTYFVTSIQAALEQAKALFDSQQTEKVFCIGGGQIYRDMINHPHCKTLYITKVLQSFDCDAFFPEYETSFTCHSSTDVKLSAKQHLQYQFQTWVH